MKNFKIKIKNLRIEFRAKSKILTSNIFSIYTVDSENSRKILFFKSF